MKRTQILQNAFGPKIKSTAQYIANRFKTALNNKAKTIRDSASSIITEAMNGMVDGAKKKKFYPTPFSAPCKRELSIMKREYESDSIIQTRRFIIQTVVSAIALCASVVAAVAAVIPLLRCV